MSTPKVDRHLGFFFAGTVKPQSRASLFRFCSNSLSQTIGDSCRFYNRCCDFIITSFFITTMDTEWLNLIAGPGVHGWEVIVPMVAVSVVLQVFIYYGYLCWFI
jgi:hypothetical protein